MPSKFDLIEQGFALSPFEEIDRPPIIVPKPFDVLCTPRLINSADSSESYSLDIQWREPLNQRGQREVWVSSYYVEIKRGEGGSWGNRQEVSSPYARYENVGSGIFYARVAAVVGANRKVSQWAESGAGNITKVQAAADASSANYSFFVTEF